MDSDLEAEDGLDVLGHIGGGEEGPGEAVGGQEGPVGEQRREAGRAVLAVGVPLDGVLMRPPHSLRIDDMI